MRGQGHDGLLLAALAARGHLFQAPAVQFRFGPETAQHVMRRLDLQAAQIDFAGADAMLRVRISRMPQPQKQAEKRARLAAVLDGIWAVQRKHIGGDPRPDAGRGAQNFDLWIAAAQVLDASRMLALSAAIWMSSGRGASASRGGIEEFTRV